MEGLVEGEVLGSSASRHSVFLGSSASRHGAFLGSGASRHGVVLYGGEVFAEGGDAFEGGLEGFEIAGIAAALGETPGGALDVANVFEGFAEFGEEVGFGEELFDGVESSVEGVEVAERVEEPVTELARTHGGGGAIEGGEEGVLGAGAGLDEVEVELGGGVDEDVGAVVADAEGGEVFAVAAELVGEVMEGGSSGADGGGHVGASKAVKRFDLEVVL